MKQTCRSAATAVALVLAVAGLVGVGAAPAQADNVNAAPLRSVGGAAGGLLNPYAATRTSAGTWVGQLNSLMLFATNATGDAAPLRRISGSNTRLGGVYDVTTDAAGRLYVATGFSILVFPASASGNVAPSRVISGPATRLSNPTGVAFDAQGNLYVADYTDQAIRVFAPGASSASAPIRVIQGGRTGLSSPLHLAVTGDRIWVANPGDGGSVTAYARSAAGNVSPAATIKGPLTGLSSVTDATVDRGGHLYVGNGPRVSMFAAGARGNVTPLRVLTGPATGLTDVFSVEVNSANQIMTVDATASRFSLFTPLTAPATAPSTVRALKVKGKVGAAKRTVVWKKPGTDGGAAVLDQQVQVAKGGKVYLTRSVGKDLTKTVLKRGKLRQGKNVVWVRARNAVGYGPWVTKKFRVGR